jgi:hypothetical protein
VQGSPRANVVSAREGEETRASVFLPMSDSVVFSWVDAVPEDLRARVRANASLYHAVHAEEGVLHGLAIVVYEITHGETSLLELEVPLDTQVNRISAASGGVSDWAVSSAEEAERKKIDVFLDRAVKGELRLEVSYERVLGSSEDAKRAFPVPLLRAVDVHRQHGMLALLSGDDLGLEPVQEERLSRVGENQLPAFVRERLTRTVAHTYKYSGESSSLSARTVIPEKKRGKFDARVDTLISIGDVTMRGSASVEVNVKSGSITELSLGLPADANVLGVSGRSIRSHRISAGEEGQSIEIAFTQEMEGQFRVEVSYERITADGETQVPVPTLAVRGCRGRAWAHRRRGAECARDSARPRRAALEPGHP